MKEKLYSVEAPNKGENKRKQKYKFKNLQNKFYLGIYQHFLFENLQMHLLEKYHQNPVDTGINESNEQNGYCDLTRATFQKAKWKESYFSATDFVLNYTMSLFAISIRHDYFPAKL